MKLFRLERVPSLMSSILLLPHVLGAQPAPGLSVPFGTGWIEWEQPGLYRRMPPEGTVAGFDIRDFTKLENAQFGFRVPSLDARWGDYRLDGVAWDPQPRPPATEESPSPYHGFLMQSGTEVRGFFSQRVSESIVRGWFASFASDVTCAPPDKIASWADALVASRQLGGPRFQRFGAHSLVPTPGSEPQLFRAMIDNPSCLPRLFDRLGGLAAASYIGAKESGRVLRWGAWSFAFAIGTKMARKATWGEHVTLFVDADDRARLSVTGSQETVCSDRALREKARESVDHLALGSVSFEAARLTLPPVCRVGVDKGKTPPSLEQHGNPPLPVPPRPYVESCTAAAAHREPLWTVHTNYQDRESGVLADGTSVYVGLSQYDARTGQLRWRIERSPGDHFAPSPAAVHPRTGLVAGDPYQILAIGLPTGKLLWQNACARCLPSPPVSGRVGPSGSLALSLDGRRIATLGERLTVLDARTGREMWSMPWQTHPGPVTFSHDGQRVYAVQQAHSDPSFSVLAANAVSGAHVWKLSTSLPSEAVLRANTMTTSSDGRLVFVSGSTWLERGRPFVLIAIDTSTGTPRWTSLDPIRHAEEDIVLRLDEARGIVRAFGTGPGGDGVSHDVFEGDYDLATGQARRSWNHGLSGLARLAVSLDGRRVYAAAQDPIPDRDTGMEKSELVVIAFDAGDGTVAWCAKHLLPQGGFGMPALAIAPDGRTVFVVSQDLLSAYES